MFKQLIDDSRLTSTMGLSRSGSTHMFREKNPEDLSFINTNNADVILEPPKRSYYAKLIDNKWYWLEGCAECRGEPRNWSTYVECEEHNVCRVCKTKYTDVETAWGGRDGWICDKCEKARLKEEAFEKFRENDYKDHDFLYLSEILCPHCGTEICSDSYREDGNITCWLCEGEIKLEIEYTASYSTRIIGERKTH